MVELVDTPSSEGGA